MEKKFGLIGKKLSHSWSKEIHEQLGSVPYALVELEENDVESFIKNKDFDGINVTIPYKKTVMPLLDRIDDDALKIGSVNTIVKENDGTLTGYNTDYFGFCFMLKKANIEVKDKIVLVLGSGGASVTALSVVRDKGAKEIFTISRNCEDNYTNLEKHRDAQIIINCTPVGMYPENLVSPLDISIFPDLESVVDCIYNPKRSALILQSEKLGINHISGLSMLVAQAKKSSEYFQRKEIDDSQIDIIVDKLEKQTENIVLIGMPGCGKSSVGRRLSREINREFVDTDGKIVERINMTILKFINEKGEDEFRKIESEIIEQYSKQKNLVIATGGGAILKERNRDALRQNSIVFFLNRDVTLLPTDGRPLSQKNNLNKMLEFRLPLYRACCDIEMEQTSIENTVKQIKETLK